MPGRLAWERAGVRLAGLDYGGDGPAVVLLHGLAGYAGEWPETAGWLSEVSCRRAGRQRAWQRRAAPGGRVTGGSRGRRDVCSGAALTALGGARRPVDRRADGVECPALIVRPEHGIVSAADAAAMIAHGRQVWLVEVPDAGHDVHLERPDEWRRALTDFLDGLP